MKKLLLILSLAFISACSAEYDDKTAAYTKVPPELSDCKFYWMREEQGNPNGITVVRCPNSTTSTTAKVGKTQTTTVVIDGVPYVEQQEDVLRKVVKAHK